MDKGGGCVEEEEERGEVGPSGAIYREGSFIVAISRNKVHPSRNPFGTICPRRDRIRRS